MCERIGIAALLAAVFVLSTFDRSSGEEPASQPAPILRPGQTQADLRAYLLEHTPHFVASSDPVQWMKQAKSLWQIWWQWQLVRVI